MACFIATEPKELREVMLKIQTRCASLWSRPRTGNGGAIWARQTLMMHQYTMLGHLDAASLVRERPGLDTGQSSSSGSQKLKPLAQNCIKEPHEDAKSHSSGPGCFV